MKKIATFLICSFVGCSFAQLDGSHNTDFSMKGINNHQIKDVKTPLNLENGGFDGVNGFKTAKQDLDNQREQERREQEELNKGIITPKQVAQQNHQKYIEGNFLNFPQIDMDLGSFHTKSKHLNIVSYDFGRFDGDRFQVVLNGKIVQQNVLLTPNAQGIKLPLLQGINRVEVIAINEGKLIPNTGYFAFYDDNKQVVKEGKWMLATGAKVIAVVIREK